jgi:uncharacterized protein (UPF0332 family)
MTPEQTALLQKAGQSLAAARLLAGENFYDFAVSRAYYAMFYVAEAILLIDSLSFSKHSAVIAGFGQHFVKTGRAPAKFHRYLIEGQDSRLIGDYDPIPALSHRKALEQIHRAEEFLKFGVELLGSTIADE